jgi:hypothetical protein
MAVGLQGKTYREPIDAGPVGDLSYITTSYGRPYSVSDGFATWIRYEVCRKIGLDECSPHGLRKVAAVRCAGADATEYEMMALFGWDKPDMARVYIEAAR